MAKADKNAADLPKTALPAAGRTNVFLLMAAIGLISGATGFAVPMVLLNKTKLAEAMGAHADPGKRGKTQHDSAKHDSKSPTHAEPGPVANQPAYVPFGEVVVNLAEEKMTRYLRVSLALQVDAAHEDIVKKAVEKKKTVLKNWLIGYLADKELEEVRGALGLNRARREIQDQFNRLLFPGGGDLIQEILFEEFNVT